MHKNLSYKILFLLSFILVNTLSKAQYISVDTNYNAQQLVDKFLGTNNSCITISNVSIIGWTDPTERSYGYFDKNGSLFSIDEGIILSTGKAKAAEGPKGVIQRFTKNSWAGDPYLEAALNMQNTLDATILEFDFTSSLNDKISFDYMFLSEQYLTNPASNQCQYTDGFAFLIKEKNSTSNFTNIALVPNTSIPVAVNTVRGITDNGNCPPANVQYFGQYNSRFPNLSPTNFNGETKVLTATADIKQGKTYTIRLVVADQGNGLYDSAVFLKAGSFVGNKDLGPDLIMENNKAMCTGENYEIDATPNSLQGTANNFIWKKDGSILPIGYTTFAGTTVTNNTSKLAVNAKDSGSYEVEINLTSGCKLKGKIKIDNQIPPSYGAFDYVDLCDDDLDGKVDVYFAGYTQSIITNIQTTEQTFNIKYFKDEPTDINNPDFSKAIDHISFSTPEQKVWLWVKPGNCDAEKKEITFKKNKSSIPNNYTDIIICDDKLEGSKEINLSDFQNIIANNIDGTPRFYKTETDAREENNVLNNTKIILTPTSQNKYYIRYHQKNSCDDVRELKFAFKQPAKSTTLENIPPICKSTTTTLDAGSGPGTGFSSYKWSYIDPVTLTNATTREIKNVPAGKYSVELGYNGCIYTQTVEVKEVPTAIIDAIDINGSTVTVTAIGGTAPYRYAIDDNSFLPGTFQNSPTFTNVALGNHTIYVKSNDDCESVARDFSVINIANVISPNADGKNDVINLSELLNKTEAHFKIYNRNGILVFNGNSGNKFIWDGKHNGHALPTGTYWYIAEWIEPTSGKTQQIKSWVLLKNY